MFSATNEKKLITFGNLHDFSTCNIFVRKSSKLSIVMCITISSPTPTDKVNSSAIRAASRLNNPAIVIKHLSFSRYLKKKTWVIIVLLPGVANAYTLRLGYNGRI